MGYRSSIGFRLGLVLVGIMIVVTLSVTEYLNRSITSELENYVTEHTEVMTRVIGGDFGAIEDDALMLAKTSLAIAPNVRRSLLVPAIMLTLIAMVLVLAVTFYYIKPLNKLAEQASRLSRGYLNEAIHMDGTGEVLVLAHAMDNMRLQFRQLMGAAVSKAMVWEGKLEFLALSQLLAILRVTKRTGALMINGKSGLGLVYVEDGEVIGARYNNFTGSLAFGLIFCWENGYFKFNAEMKVNRDEIEKSWHGLMLEGARRVSSLRLIEGYIPSFSFSPKLVPYTYHSEITEMLNAQETELLEEIDGKKSVQELAYLLQWTPEKAQRYLYRLAVVGLIESDYLPPDEPPPTRDNLVELWKYAARS